ncbi:DUF4982 domain-containing protein [Pedobacter terrae]|uniref:DUF4982 domain-containing protein n=1 Tax=Pedobacter terrae TaxID=405671 RepID=UPI002FFCC72B
MGLLIWPVSLRIVFTFTGANGILKNPPCILCHTGLFLDVRGQVTPVFAYTNYPSAELFINNKSQGKQSKNKATSTSRYRLMWNNVKYEPGEIKVIAYDENGKPVAEQSV